MTRQKIKNSCEEFLTFREVTIVSTAGEIGWQFTHWINDTIQGQVLTDYAPHMQLGEKTSCNFLYTWRRDYAPISKSHLAFFFPLQAERAAEGSSERGRLLEEGALPACLCILHFLLAVWSPAECEQIGHRGRATSWKHDVISIWLLLIEDVSAVEWVMTQEPSCSAIDGLQTPPHTEYTTHTSTIP